MDYPISEEALEAMERAWRGRDIADIPGSPWRVGSALREEFREGFMTALSWRGERPGAGPDDPSVTESSTPPISGNGLEAATKALVGQAEALSGMPEMSSEALAWARHAAKAAINAFLEEEGFEVEENILPTSYEKRLVGPWRAFEG